MRTFAAILLIFSLSLPFAHGQKTRFGQAGPKAKPGVAYPIKVHISKIHLGSDCTTGPVEGYEGYTTCQDVAYADATIDGKRVELTGNWAWFPGHYQTPLSIGDYEARLLKDTPKASVSPFYREYELVLADRTVWRCTVTGISE